MILTLNCCAALFLVDIIHINNFIKSAIAKGAQTAVLTPPDGSQSIVAILDISLIADVTALQNLIENWDFLQQQVAMYVNSDLPGFPKAIVKPIRALSQRLKVRAARAAAFRLGLTIVPATGQDGSLPRQSERQACRLLGAHCHFARPQPARRPGRLAARAPILPSASLAECHQHAAAVCLPCLSLQVGVPERVARIMTFPERVTAHNIEKLRAGTCGLRVPASPPTDSPLVLLPAAIRNGPDIHPGANFVEFASGMKVFLKVRLRCLVLRCHLSAGA